MNININFESFKDYSSVSYGIKLLEILNSEGLEINKYNYYEPIKHDFTEDSSSKYGTKVYYLKRKV